MTNLNIEQALVTQNPHWHGEVYKHPIKRLHDKTALSEISLDEILIITGIRRCGKSGFCRIIKTKSRGNLLLS